MFVLMKSQRSLEMGHVESKTGSQGQILEKPCVGSRGHIFSPIIMNLSQNVYPRKTCTISKFGHVGSQIKLLCQNLEKKNTLCTL